MSEVPKIAVHTPEEAAEILRCTVSWLKEQARLRKIPFTMPGGAYRFTGAHLDQILLIFEHQPGEKPAKPSAARPRAAARPSAVAGSAAVPLLTARQPRRPRVRADAA